MLPLFFGKIAALLLNKEETMRYTTLNNNEIIPSLGIGTYRISPTDFYRIGANLPTR